MLHGSALGLPGDGQGGDHDQGQGQDHAHQAGHDIVLCLGLRVVFVVDADLHGRLSLVQPFFHSLEFLEQGLADDLRECSHRASRCSGIGRVSLQEEDGPVPSKQAAVEVFRDGQGELYPALPDEAGELGAGLGAGGDVEVGAGLHARHNGPAVGGSCPPRAGPWAGGVGRS